MKLLIVLPNWIGDAVMATPSIEKLIEHYKPKEITLLGTSLTLALFSRDVRFTRCIVDDSKKSSNRFKGLVQLAQKLGSHDVAVNFRNTLLSQFLLWKTQSKERFGRKTNLLSSLFLNHNININTKQHYVKRYAQLAQKICNDDFKPGELKLFSKTKKHDNPTVAIVPGAAYGSAKRWYPQKYAEVAINLASKFDIILLGGPAEADITQDIVTLLKAKQITNYQDLAGKTSIEELVDIIAGVDLFIGGDSGPMHIAAAMQVPTVAIYGPTNEKESYPWANKQHIVIRKDLECAPCAKRTCPLKHHECMKDLGSDLVLSAVERLIK